MALQSVKYASRLIVALGIAGIAWACGDSNGATSVANDAGGGDSSSPFLTGLSITSIALLQGPKAVLVKDGAIVASPNAPIIAARPGLLRVYVTPDAGWTARSVTAELHLVGISASTVVPLEMTVSVASADATPGSTFDFPLSALDLPAGTKISVTLRDQTGATLSFPSDGSSLDLHAIDAMVVKLYVVPLQYNADGSGRVSDLSAVAIQTLHDVIFSTFPASSVDISIRAEPLPFGETITADGAGWTDAFDAVKATRMSDHVADDTYIVGLVDPTASYSTFCGATCTVGLTPNPEDADAGSVGSRNMIMVGFLDAVPRQTPRSLAITMTRLNAPCGSVVNPDPAFPYANGLDPGVGYDVVSGTIVPSGYPDITSNCGPPNWITDYTFAGLATRIAVVDGD